MSKHSEYTSISEFCERNGFKVHRFYKLLNRHPELARKMKINSAGKRVLDEKAMQAAAAILRKEKNEDRRKRSAVNAAGEINILIAKNEELGKEVTRLKCENEKLRNALMSKNKNLKK